MKKIFYVFLLIACFAEARFFVGFDGGVSYSMYQKDNDIFGKAGVIEKKYLYGGYLGVNLGTEHYFARDSLLFRWFLSVGGDVGIAYGDLNLGVDLMGTLYKSDTSAFGLFLGIEMSTVFMDWISGFGGALRLGMSTLFDSQHRIELFWRKRLGEFSVSQTNYITGVGLETIYTRYKQNDTIMLAYKRLF